MISKVFQLVVLTVTIAFFSWVISLLKKRKLDLKYTLLWLLCGLIMLIMGVFPASINYIAQLFGVYSPTNALFAIISLFLILLSLSLTIIVSKQNDSIKKMAQRIAILEKKIREQEYGK